MHAALTRKREQEEHLGSGEALVSGHLHILAGFLQVVVGLDAGSCLPNMPQTMQMDCIQECICLIHTASARLPSACHRAAEVRRSVAQVAAASSLARSADDEASLRLRS